MRSSQLPEFVQGVYREERARFLASLFAPQVQREQIWALLAFDLELSHIPHKVREEMLGHIRFTWWREALDELDRGNPARRHPVVEALQPLMKHAAVKPHLYALLDAHQKHFPEMQVEYESDITLPVLNAINVITTNAVTDVVMKQLAQVFSSDADMAKAALAELRGVSLPKPLSVYRVIAQDRQKKRRSITVLVIKMLFCK